MYAALWRRNHDDVVVVELLGAVHLTIAALLWLRVDVPWLMPWLVGFLVLTICAERVELARLAMPASGGRTLVLHAAALTVALVLTLVSAEAGRAAGLVIASLVVWLVRHDVARRTIRTTGLPRVQRRGALLGGMPGCCSRPSPVGGRSPDRGRPLRRRHPRGHAGLRHLHGDGSRADHPSRGAQAALPYRPIMWIPLVLMHVGLAVRILAGDFAGLRTLWQVGSVTNIVALLLFFAVAAGSSIAGAPALRRRTS